MIVMLEIIMDLFSIILVLEDIVAALSPVFSNVLFASNAFPCVSELLSLAKSTSSGIAT